MSDHPADQANNIRAFPRRCGAPQDDPIDATLREDRLCDLIQKSEQLLNAVPLAGNEKVNALVEESRRLRGLAMLGTVQSEDDAIAALEYVLKRIAQRGVEDATVHDTIEFHFVSQVSTFLAKQLEAKGGYCR
jgi:hypothetical protein